MGNFNVYDHAFQAKIDNPGCTDEEAIRHVLFDVIKNPPSKQSLIELIGEEAYFDSQYFEYKFYTKKFEEFSEEAFLVEVNISDKIILGKEKLEIIYGGVYDSYLNLPDYQDALYWMIAEKIRKMYFPSLGLESTIMAHGENYLSDLGLED